MTPMTTVTMPGTLPAEPATPIRPSEAIRLGCLIAPVQGVDMFSDDGSVCVLGAMALGLGWTGKGDGQAEYDFVKPRLGGMDRRVMNPSNGHNQPLYVVLYRLNDTGWSRERIADWLAEQGL